MATVHRERALAAPGEVALRDSRTELSWTDVDRVVNRVADGLHGLDLGPDRRVAVFARNSVETVLAHVGIVHAGCSPVPTSFHLTAPELAYILTDSRAAALFVGPENAAVGYEAARRAGVPVVVGWRCPDGDGDVVPWDRWLAAASDDDPPADVPALPFLSYTSGTTGTPKGVNALAGSPVPGTTVDEYVRSLRTLPLAQWPGHLVVGPLHHTGPLAGVRLVACGLPVTVLEKFDAEAVLATVARYRIATTLMVPTHFHRLLALPGDVRARYDVGSLRLVTHTGATCPPDVKRAMIDWFGPVLFDSYGGSESGPLCGISTEDWLERPGSVGRVRPPFVRAVAVAADGTELPPGAVGRLAFEERDGRSVAYLNAEQKTSEALIRPGLFTLGDIGYVDADGFVFITDRATDMIISGGVNIYPAEIEHVLLAHPDVADVAVIGVPDPEMGESVLAVVVPRGGAPTAADLVAHCRTALAGYKVPRAFEFRDDLGRTAMGKLAKRLLREPYWTARAQPSPSSPPLSSPADSPATAVPSSTSWTSS
ncbi:AMP-binding protein [Rhodococcus sp. SGAir0479]|uniref:AMP-binding protein n=1 Tax=Rhodococcus sp. SGAir0479 TaxID=2567884 RepID=UPI0010CD2BB3|nr:AMP-binding protein [Rhodococcus sp. SGAir0479]QCQ90911.1 acyl--CoA ligase [Rhodococcus sp. SGAir0479]